MSAYMEGFPTISSIEAGLDAHTNRSCLVAGLDSDRLTPYPLQIDFGAVGLGQYSRRRIYLRNDRIGSGTALLSFPVYGARANLAPQYDQIHAQIQAFECASTAKEGQVAFITPEIGFKNRHGQSQIRREALRRTISQVLDHEPVQFLAWPNLVDLAGGSGSYIDLYCLTNLPGSYQDVLYCKMSGSEQDVVQVPVQVQIGGSVIDHPSRLTIGPVLTRSGIQTKTLSLSNRAATGLLVYWNITREHPSDRPVALTIDVLSDGAVQCQLQPNEGSRVPWFSVEPATMIIPARSCASVSVSYRACDDIEAVRAYLHADIQIEVGKQWKPGPKQLYRDPVCIELYGESITPRITLLKNAPVKLLSDQRQNVVKTIALVNQLPIPLAFNCKISNPKMFSIVATETKKPRSSSPFAFQVEPGESIGLTICFKADQAKDIHSAASLCIGYSNGSKQELPLYGRVLLPELHLLQLEYDFGYVFVNTDGQNQNILVRNLSHTSNFSWRIVHVRRSLSKFMPKALDPGVLRTFSNAEFDPHRDTLDDASVFHFSETAGHLSSSEKQKTISVVFHPTARRQYLSTFRIEYGGQDTERFTLTGWGSVNEIHDKQLSRLYIRR